MIAPAEEHPDQELADTLYCEAVRLGLTDEQYTELRTWALRVRLQNAMLEFLIDGEWQIARIGDDGEPLFEHTK